MRIHERPDAGRVPAFHVQWAGEAAVEVSMNGMPLVAYSLETDGYYAMTKGVALVKTLAARLDAALVEEGR